MVVCTWLLILLLAPTVLQAGDQTPAKNQCLQCHPVHYAERASCVDCHRGVPNTSRLDLAHSGLIAARFAAFTLGKSPVVKRGEERLKDYACRRCHVSAGTGNRLAAHLDLAQKDLSPEEMAEAIKTPVLFMPEFHFTEEQRIELVNALLAGGRRAQPEAGEVPAVVHFEREGKPDERLFEKHCGGCHRVLTARFGGLGGGLIGPNLSGLFSEFYPKNFGAEKLPWNKENLEKWLKNPRKIRPLTQMPPLRLEPAEVEKLSQELFSGAALLAPVPDEVPGNDQ